MKLSRRNLLAAGSAGFAGSLLGIPKLAHAQRPGKKAKNIIFCVSDGMAASVPTMATQLSEMMNGSASYWSWLMRQDFVVNGLQDTRSLSSLVTDSSAASSTWGSGRRIWNAQVNMYPDGTKLRPIADIMHEAGVRTGLVTTATITHATPAGFGVAIESRGLEGKIAELYLDNKLDVLMGGGDKFFNPAKRKDKMDLYAKYASAGYKVVKTSDELKGLKAGKILGIFNDSHVPYSVDAMNSEEISRVTPTLAEMAMTAIDNLKGGSNGFLLQIEGARIDHACHGNDLAGAIYDQLAFEEAVKVAIEFAQADGETLVVITADHATGGINLNGSGDEYFDSTGGLRTLLGMKCSYGPLSSALGSKAKASHVKDVMESKLGLKMSTEDAQLIADATDGKSPFGGSIFMRGLNATLGMVIGNYSKTGWTCLNHTNEYVITTAYGPGMEQFAGLCDNVDYFNYMLASKDLKWENPRQMTFEEAMKAREKGGSKIPEEWIELYASDDEEESGYHL
ncbi:MAG: alkaline phosphatase [Fimbriimonadaceae bacterium]|nr:alkaline phosphatase [Fimbriimonadaceae bacterium]